MRVLIVSPIDFPSRYAPANRLWRMAESLVQSGHHVEFVASKGDGEFKCPFQVHAYPRTTSVLPGYPGVLRRQRFVNNTVDVVLSQGAWDIVIAADPSWLGSRKLLQISHRHGVPVVFDMVEWFGLSMRRLVTGQLLDCRMFRNRVLPLSDGVIGITQAWCEWAESHGLPNVWIPSFAHDCGRMRSEAPPPGSPLTLCFIGHWFRREMPSVIMKAMQICLAHGLDIRMNTLGDVGISARKRDRRAMSLLSKDAGLREHVHFMGFVTNEERDRQLAQADAFIILRENNRETDMLFPTRLPEYMLTGNPVILSKVGSFPHCFEHLRDVWFVSKNNTPQEVAEAFMHLAQNPLKRLAIGWRGRQTALKQFSLAALGDRLTKFLATVAGHAPADLPSRTAEKP